LWTYDVWGNDEDGYTVNDRCKQGVLIVPTKREVHNAGTPDEFVTENPTDRQLCDAIDRPKSKTEWEGESDYTLYATNPRNGYPICELEFEGWEE